MSSTKNTHVPEKKVRELEPVSHTSPNLSAASPVQGEYHTDTLFIPTTTGEGIHIKAPTAPRNTCVDCVRKHVAQAVVLLTESLLGYPEHKWLALAHLSEAMTESLKEYPLIAYDIQTDIQDIMEDKETDIMKYLSMVFDSNKL